MTTKVLTGTYSAGYTLAAPITLLSIAASGYVGGTGLATAATATAAYTVVNDGRIIAADSPGVAGVFLAAGGAVTNGGVTDTAARIAGYRGVEISGGRGTVSNFGSIIGDTRSAVWLNGGGTVNNGDASHAGALIAGGVAGVSVDMSGRVNNFGTISQGVQFVYHAGGNVANGSAADTAAKILSTGIAVNFSRGVGHVSNFGVIQGGGGAGSIGVFIGGGASSLANGVAGDTTASIYGYDGVWLAGGKIANYGTIAGSGLGDASTGVVLIGKGRLTNGALSDQTALISGSEGVFVPVSLATIVNYGTIEATGGLPQARSNAAASEFLPGVGAYLGYGALINGAATDAGALIEGYFGVVVRDAGATVTNFGTIVGTNGIAVDFISGSNTLAVEAGCAFKGEVLGAGGVLDLASGAGTISAFIGTDSGTVTVSGSMAPTAFTDFHTVEIGAGASFTTVHAVNIVAGDVVLVAGKLGLGTATTTVVNAGIIETDGGTATVKGALDNTGRITANGGVLTIDGPVTGGNASVGGNGTLRFLSSFTGSAYFFDHTGVLSLAQSQTYTGTVSSFSTSGASSLDLGDIAFVGSGEATFSGTSTSGVLTVTDGTHTAHFNMNGANYLKAAFVASSDHHGGTIVVAQPGTAAVSPSGLIAAMAALGPAAATPVHSSAAWPLRDGALFKPRAMTA